MDITVKCPNCFQQVPKGNQYCVFCGCDLLGSMPTPEDADSAMMEHDYSGEDTAHYDGPRYCPKGHDVPDPSLGFCPTCGSPLVDDPSMGMPSPEEPTEHRPSARPVTRKCRCGYVCDDPDLSFCPACGMPFDAPDTVTGGEWTCLCGKTNPSDMDFCIECAKPRGWRADEPKPEKDIDSFIPYGMKPPTDSDLDVKSRYGN